MKIPLHLVFIAFFLSLGLLSTSQTPTQLTDPSYYYNLCAPSRCNNLTLSYPFALPSPCHPPDSIFQPLCPKNESLLLTSRFNNTFRVLSMNSTPTMITVNIASNSLFTCGTRVYSQNHRNSDSIVRLPFDYTIGTHFNCTGPISSDSFQGIQNASCIGCKGQDPSNICYYVPGRQISPPGCERYFIFTRAEFSFNASRVRDLRAFLQLGFQVDYKKPPWCLECETSGGRCGTNPVSGSIVCFCPSSVHSTNCADGMVEDVSQWVTAARTRGHQLSRTAVAAISSSVSILLLVVIVALVMILVRRRKQHIDFNMESISSVSPTRYSYSQLKKFTNNFASKLGEGGFASVYKGTIHPRDVAVKVMKKSKKTEKQFISELQTIGSIHHHNLLGVLGYCLERNTCALVYEFMENGSLDKHIYNSGIKETDLVEDASENDTKEISCKQTYNIALETARGILYLHQGCRKRILHCDIKPSNILLDLNLSPKVADFGLARVIEKDHSHVSLTEAQGTPGYAAPEIWLKAFGPVTEKSDVYSYGMLLLEMVGRRKIYDPKAADFRQVYYPEWLYNKLERDEFHLPLNDEHSEKSRNEEDEVAIRRMSLVGLCCIQHIPSNRPAMDTVIQMLEGHVEIGIPFAPNNTRGHQSTSQDFVACSSGSHSSCKARATLGIKNLTRAFQTQGPTSTTKRAFFMPGSF